MTFLPVKNVLDHLTDDQKKVMKELREIAEKSFEEWKCNEEDKKEIANDLTIWRYARGYGWDAKAAAHELKRTFDWRKSYCPEKMRFKDLKYGDKHMIFQYGSDNHGQPVQYIVLRNDDVENNEENVKEKFKLLVYNFQMCIAQMKEPVISVVNVVELDGGSLSFGVVKTLKGMFDELGIYYTERSAKIIVLNAGWGLNALWYFVKSFLPQHVC